MKDRTSFEHFYETTSPSEQLSELLRGLEAGPAFGSASPAVLYALGQAISTQAKRATKAETAAPITDAKPDYMLRAYVADLIHCSEFVIRNGEPISPADRKIAISRIDSIRDILTDVPEKHDPTDDRNWQLKEGDPFAPRKEES